jgi:lipid-A-disaccharide synthase
MKKEADGLLKHYSEVTIMGFIEVLMKLRTIKKNLDLCKNQIKEYQPDRIICIDYPGFNLRIAKYCKANGIRVSYYIAPKIWAWKENRGKLLEQYVDDLLLIFPFEIDYFKKWKVQSTYVGNPLQDELKEFIPDPLFRESNGLDNRPIIALLPGSRKQEISNILPVMIEATQMFTNQQLVIAGAPGIDNSFYKPYLNNRLHLVRNVTYQLLYSSEAAVVCSGTATLETALMNIPQVCGYSSSFFTWLIAKMVLRTKYISLVNLCMNKWVIKELIQFNMNAANLKNELESILPGGSGRIKMLEDYKELQHIIGGPGASDRAAEIIVASKTSN